MKRLLGLSPLKKKHVQGIKAYILNNGYMELDENLMVNQITLATVLNRQRPNNWIKIPIYCVLIHHPIKGWILFDTGCNPAGMNSDYWSANLQEESPWYYNDNQLLTNQLAQLSLKPSEIGSVILSHMHLDHAGGLYLFKDTADIYVSKSEFLNALFTVHATQQRANHGSYIKDDIETPVQRYHFITKDFEIAPGIEVVNLPGHSPGTLGIVVHLDSQTIIFPSDAVYTALNYGPPARMAGIVWDTLEYVNSVEKVRELEQKYNAKVMFSHDIEQFLTFKLAPAYYE